MTMDIGGVHGCGPDHFGLVTSDGEGAVIFARHVSAIGNRQSFGSYLPPRGFNGFSYADVAAELKLSKAALHYHFASKADLGEALIARYSEHFGAALDALDAGAESARAKLEGYVTLYEGVLRDERMCLCGMLAAEHETLPAAMRDAVVAFFDFNEVWLSNVLEQGEREGDLQFADSAIVRARILMGGLEGALLVARPYGDVSRFQQIAMHLIRDLEAPPSTARSG